MEMLPALQARIFAGRQKQHSGLQMDEADEAKK